MKNATKTGNKQPLRTYIDQLQGFLKQCQLRYTEFLEKLDLARISCAEISRECEARKSSAKDKKNLAKVVGGGAVGVLGVGNIAVAAGLFTFGLGTVAVLGTAAFGTGMVGIMARNFARLEATFKELCKDMDTLNTEVDDLGPSMKEIERMLTTTSDNAEKVEKADAGLKDDEESCQYFEFSLFCGAFDILLDGVKSCRLRLTNPFPRNLKDN